MTEVEHRCCGQPMLSIVMAADDHTLEMLQCLACSRHEWRHDGAIVRSEAATRIAGNFSRSKQPVRPSESSDRPNVIWLPTGSAARRGA